MLFRQVRKERGDVAVANVRIEQQARRSGTTGIFLVSAECRSSGPARLWETAAAMDRPIKSILQMNWMRYVHGYDNVGIVQDATVDGHILETRFDFKRTRTIAGIVDLTFDVSATTRVFGLGYSFVEIRENSIGMDMRLWVLRRPSTAQISTCRSSHRCGRYAILDGRLWAWGSSPWDCAPPS